MGGSARYRYGKKIANAIANGESEDRIAELQRERDEAIAREQARKAERLVNQTVAGLTDKYASMAPEINPVNGRTLSEASQLRNVQAREFHDTLAKAKSNQVPEDAWRVDVHDIEDYISDNDKLYLTAGGSAIAVTPDGDIISVCRNIDDDASGSDILARAVQMGGKKLDSYAGNHNFYIKNGFEPVSWCKWDDTYNDYAKQNGWDENRDEREPIIFYRYVGHRVTEQLDDFLKRVPASYDYDEARVSRDQRL